MFSGLYYALIFVNLLISWYFPRPRSPLLGIVQVRNSLWVSLHQSKLLKCFKWFFFVKASCISYIFRAAVLSSKLETTCDRWIHNMSSCARISRVEGATKWRSKNCISLSRLAIMSQRKKTEILSVFFAL